MVSDYRSYDTHAIYNTQIHKKLRNDATQYLLKQERPGRNGRIGGDARLTSVGEWQILSTNLQREGLQLVHMPTLVDQLWNEETDPLKRRPEFSRIVANLHKMEYTGLLKNNFMILLLLSL